MHKGLTKKLDFEKGRSKAKAATGGYRDRFAVEGNHFDRGGNDGNRIRLSDIAKPSLGIPKVLREDKARAVDFFQRRLRSSLLRLGSWKFQFRMAPAEFAKANGISQGEAALTLPGVQRQAEELLRMTMLRICRAPLEVHEEVGDNQRPRIVYRLRFRTFLPTFEATDWLAIFKRVAIQPSDSEIEDA